LCRIDFYALGSYNIIEQIGESWFFMESMLRRTWAEIDLTALQHNYTLVAKAVPANTAIWAVIKADAYGHGVVTVARTLQEAGATHFAVSNLEEAIQLAGDRDIYISGGARLYEQALPLAEKLYITLLHREVEGDTFFPELDETQFIKEEGALFAGDIPYIYLTYTRKPSGHCTTSEV